MPLIFFDAASLAALVAANTKVHFFTEPWDWIVAAVAALLTFVVNTLSAQAEGAAFESAARELEKAIAGYETDPTVTETDLGKSVQKGIDILNQVKRR